MGGTTERAVRTERDSGSGGPPADVVAQLARTARESFGWPSLRPGQAEPMAALLGGRDVLVVMSTGSGKSAVYQVPAVLRHGPTLVVGPLLSLQQDQLDFLGRTGRSVGPAAAASSARSAADRRDALRRFAAGELEFLFCAPEQLAAGEVLDAVRAGRPSLVVVDEAHCVSSWGQDFRPDYLQLATVIDALGHPAVAALTATASPPVREEVLDRLGLRDPLVVVSGFDRPEISLSVRHCAGSVRDRQDAVLDAVRHGAHPTLVYVTTQRGTTETADEIAALELPDGRRLRVAPYHGGMATGRRHDVHEDWLAGRLDVVVATSAFGMGIDKPDVRSVVHAEPPESLDEYLQQVGRAGRDGARAHATLVFRAADLGLRRFFVSGLPHEADLATVATLLGAAGTRGARVGELTGIAHLGRQKVLRLLDLLERSGTVVRARTRLRLRDGAPGPAGAAAAALELARRRESVEQSRVDMVRGYAETSGCRRQFLLASFGEVLQRPCGNCDTCRAGLPAGADPDQDRSPFPVGRPVRHVEWGSGEVVRYEGDRIVVLFDAVGYRTLGLDVVREHGLLRAA